MAYTPLSGSNQPGGSVGSDAKRKRERERVGMLMARKEGRKALNVEASQRQCRHACEEQAIEERKAIFSEVERRRDRVI